MDNFSKGASEATKAVHRKNLAAMDDEYLKKERHDFANTKKHLVYEIGSGDITDRDGTLLYEGKNFRKRNFEGFPDTVNPYLWQSNKNYDFAGIIRAAEGYYIALGIDIGEIGFVKSDTGWIIIDSGNYVEYARIARRAAELASGENIRDNIKAVIISHTHPDHYAGIGAFVHEDDNIPVYGPAGFEQSLIDDNLYAGVPMARRLLYQGGLELPKGERGSVGVGYPGGLGLGGHQSFHFPDILVEEDETVNIDGVELDIFLTPNTETRAHMGVYSRTHKVLFLGDNAMGTLHNVYTPRGARVRDANYWGSVFYKLYAKYGDEVCAVWQGHGLPMIKEETNDNLKAFLLDNAAAYKYTNDQALLLANKGYSGEKIGTDFKIPDKIGRVWYVRPHYGEYSFNARGIYTKYMGFYDGNPVNLHPLGKSERAAKLVEYIGSAKEVLEKAKKDFEKGQYQWVAEITNELVFLDPENTDARYLCADALEQLGYQCENALQRNNYLSAALELRRPEGAVPEGFLYMENRLVMPYTSPELLLDYLGINFDGEKAIDEEADFVFEITDAQAKKSEYHLVKIYKGTVLHTRIRAGLLSGNETVIHLFKDELYLLALGKFKPDAARFAQEALRILELIGKYAVNTGEYRNFELTEPLKRV